MNKTSVYLITGFLGSGKTTFLKRMIQSAPEEKKLMILINEFGETGIDGPLINNDHLELMEISRGSIFCACVKSDFIRGLMEIATRIRPDILIIEATGVANPADMKKNLSLSFFKDQFEMKEQTCVIDAGNFMAVYDTFLSVEKQLETSTLFLLNKVDNASTEEITKIRNIIAAHHTAPDIRETTYAQIPMDFFREKLNDESSLQTPPEMPENPDALIDQVLNNPEMEHAPPDRMTSFSFAWNGSCTDALKDLLSSFPDGLIRAKGFIRNTDGTFLINRVLNDVSISDIPGISIPEASVNRIVCIGTPEAVETARAAATLSSPFRIGVQPSQ